MSANGLGQHSELNPGKYFSGVTMSPGELSSLDESSDSWRLPQPNFITECFFLSHLALSTVEKKLEHQYEQLSKAINKAAHAKDLATFEE